MKMKNNTKFITNEASAQVEDFKFSFAANQMRPYINNDGEVCIVGNEGQEISVNGLNVNATLPYDAWKDIDREVLEVSTERLVAVNDLLSRGLTHDVGGIGHTISQWDKISNMTSMYGETSSEEDRQTFDTDSVAIPILHKSFSLPWRARQAAMSVGASLDVTGVNTATRLVSELSEDMMFSGLSVSVGGATVKGYTNFADRNTVSLGTSWTSVTNYQDIIDDVVAMCNAARNDNFHGSYTIYIPNEYEGIMDNDFKVGTGDTRTLRDRILQIASVGEIKVADRLADDNVILVQLTREVVDLATAQDIIAVDWTEDGTFTNNHRVFAALAPRLKSDYDSKCGIVHLS